MGSTPEAVARINAEVADLERNVSFQLGKPAYEIPPALLDASIEALASVADARRGLLYPDVAIRVWSTLAGALKSRFIQQLEHGTARVEDIDQAIILYRAALELLPEGADLFALLGHLAQAHFARCIELPNDARAVHDAVVVSAQALDVLPADHPHLLYALQSAAALLRLEMPPLGGDLGLQVLAESFRRALGRAPAGGEVERESARAHAETLRLIRERGDSVSLSEEVTAWRQVLVTAQVADGHARNVLYHIGDQVLQRHLASGSASDLDMAIDALSAAAEAAEAEPTPQPAFFAMLGHALGLRAEAGGPSTADDLDAAVWAMRTALRASSTGEEQDAASTRLCSLLLQRFEASRQWGDLDEVIDRGQGVYDRQPDVSAALASPVASTLARALTLRGELTASSVDSAVAHFLRYQLSIRRDTGQDSRLIGISKAVLQRPYSVLAAKRRTDGQPDLALVQEMDETITRLRQAINGPTSDTARMELREGLVDALMGRHMAVPEPVLLDELIAELPMIIAEIPEHQRGHRVAHRLCLGLALQDRFRLAGRPADLDAAVDQCRRIVDDEAAATQFRIRAACLIGRTADFGHWQTAHEAFGRAISLLPRLVGRSLAPDDHLRETAIWSELASDAAAVAVRAGAPHEALELLERGRGLLLGRALDSRGDLDQILAADPEQAPQLIADLRRIGDELAVSEGSPDPNTPHARQSDVDRRRALVRAWDQTVVRIRRLPGCANFLAPVTIDQLMPAAAAGPVVTVNVSRYGSHALVLTRDGVDAVPLPQVTVEALQEQAAAFLNALPFAELQAENEHATHDAQQPLRDVLSWLWSTVAGPVLAHLGRDGSPPSRIWWIPTGSLAALPLHAAGTSPGQSVLDLAVSSYAPTVTSLLRAANRYGAAEPASPAVQLIGIRAAPGRPSLSGVTAEVKRILRRVPHAQQLLDGEATCARVRSRLRAGGWLHVACHASSYPNAPADSALHLYDGPLSIRQLLAERATHGELVYLSACATVLSSPAVPAEVIHLGTAFHITGFQHVVGTLWQVTDGTATETARLFYEGIGRIPDAGRSAQALHDAVRQLRHRYPGIPTRWAAYVHIGP
ncbi:CHAT domain-containing protein [Plantactinospora sp. S1510]|uniref:CHAT domain-containing protein n=1 Tax=Plantactinospora alkalitolerans TaxID=2789879 RepID=A0ABS0GVK4_9ACTN|nr:CHAT domain-containing protein [Plantactinospora alkalitolerans]MBF9130236.1 CHAT domain-containing protein [Plantactinospora alkalitolerans]